MGGRVRDGAVDDLARRVRGVGALADPARLELYRLVVAADDAVSREQAATALGLPAHQVRFHLDRLVADGLLEVEYRRLTGRSGPGAGRPAKLYRRSAREVVVSLPERRYDLAGHLMAEAIDAATSSGVPVDEALRASATAHGRALAVRASAAAGEDEPPAPDLPAVLAALAAEGYEPRASGGEVTLANCPFHALMREHTALVCGMNLALLSGFGEAFGCAARLDPGPGRCCVVLTVPGAPAGGALPAGAVG
ncbi:helix-turn-helix transcriptional regulator [Actinotalea fermentans]|uniref:helix-turn-helix transcriptional regulator n=1 Tax=Actinotalea fermentans TaxID=43671 RepID=UPI00051F37EF|nr:helix-turn-helix domain-containing protein [Actinotalea fermentans]KGM16405.1 hypothetical protein N867_00790 [Actinotalea fermentans ATCC 43279 = JCM 9966 = DSM 3133]